MDRAVSVIRADLDKAMLKSEIALLVENTVNKLNIRYEVHPQIVEEDAETLKKQNTTPELIEKLIRYRKQYFKKDDRAKDSLRTDAEEEFDQLYSTTTGDTSGTAGQQPMSRLILLSESVLSQLRYNTPLRPMST